MDLSSQRAGLDGVSCSITAGACAAVIGPNGAGKTTFLRLLAGLDIPQTGTVAWKGLSVRDMRLKERARRIAYLSQHEEADPDFLVSEYIQLARLPFEPDAERDRTCCDDAVERCGVRPFLHMPLGQLSGGERQRVMLARCLAQTPELLLLDEPTNHLDLAARTTLLRVVRGLSCTVVAVLHDLSLVSDFADHVLVLRQGRLALQGAADNVLLSADCQSIFGLNIQRAVLEDGTHTLSFQAKL
ncbi:ABC transporter ATP-binding protein [Neokomagataea thailandica]|nr:MULTISPECIES: ABC transporter ATP-binding protein [Neokomagataea]